MNLQLIHNASAGPLPSALDRYAALVVPVVQPGARCGRCGRGYGDHLWILRDPRGGEQDGVIDCAGVNA